MYPNPKFRKSDKTHTLDFARARGFGMLSINGKDGPLVAHLPFVISADGREIDMHMVRSNPVVRALDMAIPAVLAINGPDAYISPDWYGVKDQVPTWNYVAVHLRGELRRLPQEEIIDSITRLSENFETRLTPKPVWKLDKVAPDKLAKMARAIIPVRMRIADMDSTWKLGQNKPDGAMQGAIEGLKTSSIGHERAQLISMLEQLFD